MTSQTGRLERTWTVTADDEVATRAWGARVGRAARDAGVAGVLIALEGDLGAGKTVFVQGLAQGLGLPPDAPVVSPTFTIARSYPVPGAALVLHHLDAYRLEGAEDLEGIGFEEMRGKGCVTCVEWASRVADALPEERIDLCIEMLAMTAPYVPGSAPRAPRRLLFHATGAEEVALLRAVEDARGTET